MEEYYVYILCNLNNNKTYVGMTNNLSKRIRQHNSLIKGGARYTTNDKGIWIYHTIIENLNKSNALSIEKKIKIYSKKYKGTTIDKRLQAINYIFNN